MTYTIEKDHADLKKQIKEWEGSMDWALKEWNDGNCEPSTISNIMIHLETLSHEMMAINL